MQATLPPLAREQPAFTLGYRPSFDGLRAIGVLLVVGTHSFIERLTAAGNMGLQMFFLLSGFLITVLLLREWQRTGAISLRHFYLRRALRLLPALVVFLAVTTLFVALTFPEALRTQHYRAAFASLFYFFNWAFIYGWVQGATVVGQCWSLSVEEQFYLLWPVALIALLRLPVGRLWKMGLVAVGVIASLTARTILESRHPDSYRVFIGSDMHADAVLIGCLLAMAACWGMLPSRPSTLRALNVIGFLSLAFLIWHAIYPEPLGQSFDSGLMRFLRVSTSGIAFMTLVTTSPPLALRILEAPVLLWFGRRSYSIYLWHLAVSNYLVILTVLHQVAIPKWIIALIAAVVGIGLSALSFRWFEAPFLRMKMRFSSEPAASATVLAQTENEPAALHRTPA